MEIVVGCNRAFSRLDIKLAFQELSIEPSIAFKFKIEATILFLKKECISNGSQISDFYWHRL